MQLTIRVAVALFAASVLLTAVPKCALTDTNNLPEPIEYGMASRIGLIKDTEISESSGLARSILNPGAFWTHNDSGDVPRIFLIDRDGRTLARFVIEGAQAIDWEDMASFQRENDGYLLIGDVGDNEARRKSYTLYLVREPRVDPRSQPLTAALQPARSIAFTYEDGPQNCESVAIDPADNMVYLITKKKGRWCKVYRLRLPTKTDAEPAVARMTASLEIPRTTAMDISPDGSRAVVLTYGHAREYRRDEGESWAEAFAREPRIIRLPGRKQGEAVCYGADGQTLYLTSEGTSQPLWEVPVVSRE